MADTPNEQGVWKDPDEDLVSDIEAKYTKWRADKKNNEMEWFLNASFVRGLQFVTWNSSANRLVTQESPQHRIRLAINRVLPKVKARQSKFLKDRPLPFVIPASADRDDKLDAEASQKAIEFVLRKQDWESKYRQILNFSSICSKGFAWLHWDQGAKAVTSVPDVTGQMSWQEVPEAGDVYIEVGTPFEILVSDPGIPNISDQPEIMRIKLRELADIKKRYPTEAKDIKGEVTSDEMFQYQKQIASLDARGQTGQFNSSNSLDRSDDKKPYVVVKELFTKPCATYPQGRYVVVCAGKLLRKEDVLPFGFGETNDPYPVVEFADMESVGQFWPTTYAAQLIPLQKEYNLLRSKLGEALRLMSMPKIMSPMQAAIPKNAWNCVDKDTKVLTLSGWKNYETLTTNDKILSYDSEFDHYSWEHCTHVHQYEYSGELYRFKSRNVDALVTANHRWFVDKKNPQIHRAPQFKTTEDLVNDPKNKWHIPIARNLVLSNDADQCNWYELLGWVIAEGTYHATQESIDITQIKTKGRNRIRELLTRLNIKFTEQSRRFYIWAEDTADIKKALPNKLPSYELLTSLSGPHLQALLDGLIAGDGTIKKNGQLKYFSSNVELCELVATVGTLLGKRVSYEMAKGAHYKKMPGGTYFCQPEYVVYLGAKGLVGNNATIGTAYKGKEHYAGVIWCPTVRTGAVVFKRGNRIYVSGQSEPGEHIRYQWYPGLPTPQVIPPPQVSTDMWNCIRLIKDEFDEVTNIWPQSQGATGGSTSGFQTNLLQEATDSVHMPDIRGHEIAFEKLCKKIRFMMKQYYDVPRLIAITGRNYIPEMIEFSSDRIDENAEIIVMSKGALSHSPAVRTQQVIELWNSGIIGDRNDPKTQARALTLIDSEGIGELQEEKRRDQDLARYEIDQMNKAVTDKEPQPYEDHDIHWTVHTDFMKSFEYLNLPDEIKNLHKVHLVLHARFIDPFKAVQLALDIGLPEMAAQLQQMVAPPPQNPPSQNPPPEGQPPQAVTVPGNPV